MTKYYVPIRSPWPAEPRWLIGPFFTKKAALHWFRAAADNPKVCWLIDEPASTKDLRETYNFSVQEIKRRTLSVTTRPTVQGLREAIQRKRASC